MVPMRAPRAALFRFKWRSRSYTTASNTSPRLRDLPILADNSISVFRDHAYSPAQPALFPRGSFADLPAVEKWFTPVPDSVPAKSALNLKYIYGKTFEDRYPKLLPIEIINEQGQFFQIHQKFGLFLDHVRDAPAKFQVWDEELGQNKWV